MEENKTTQPTPEQLIKTLEMQLEMQRNLRKAPQSNRKAVLWGSVAIMIATALGLIWTMLMFLEQIKKAQPPEPPMTIEKRN